MVTDDAEFDHRRRAFKWHCEAAQLPPRGGRGGFDEQLARKYGLLPEFEVWMNKWEERFANSPDGRH